MGVRKGVKDLVAEASARIRTIDTDQAIAMAASDKIALVDLRDIRERQRDGFIPGAFHAPRGMLEFWVDPQSPYYKEFFGSDTTFVFYCASGWRSALARPSSRLSSTGRSPLASRSAPYCRAFSTSRATRLR